MVHQHGLTWSADMNCQKFARTFINEAMGLDWPVDVPVAGDDIPVIIDVSIFWMSTTNATKSRKEKKNKKKKDDSE
jgi:hypothetical protein